MKRKKKNNDDEEDEDDEDLTNEEIQQRNLNLSMELLSDPAAMRKLMSIYSKQDEKDIPMKALTEIASYANASQVLIKGVVKAVSLAQNDEDVDDINIDVFKNGFVNNQELD